MIGPLVTGSCIATLIGAAFGGVNSIMGQGKPWVRVMRSFRMASSILLHSFLQTVFRTWEEIREYLEKARLHPTGRHWVDNLIIPPCLSTSWCASRGRGIGSSSSSLLPYFFFAGHHHSTRYLSWYCVEMVLLLPAEATDYLLSGAFVCRHKAGSWNAVSAD